jgi:hypothetical protein
LIIDFFVVVLGFAEVAVVVAVEDLSFAEDCKWSVLSSLSRVV